MTQDTAVKTPWTAALALDESPGPQALREHLQEVHRRHPGFTENCAMACRDRVGRNSYEWLCDAIAPIKRPRILDLACGSGFLMQLCRARYADARSIVGVDMSAAELSLARSRLPQDDVTLHLGLAQDLSFADAGAFDAILCHWALTLMDPIEPVLREIGRVAAPAGVFAAVVDGDPDASPRYRDVNDIVFQSVCSELPAYAEHDLGDARVRSPKALATLARSVFPTADVRMETSVFSLRGPADAVAKEAAGFFYAAFVLSPAARVNLLTELANYLAADAENGLARFDMPIGRLTVRF